MGDLATRGTRRPIAPFLFVTALLVGCGPRPDDEVPTEISGLVVPMVVNATPNDGEIFISWTPPADAGSTSYVVYFRARGSGAWRASPVPTPPWPAPSVLRRHTLTGLTNGQEYELVVVDDGGARSQPIHRRPRQRKDCDHPDLKYFCSQPAADAWLRDKGLDTTTLRCRDRPVPWDLNAPSCLYSAADGTRFNLLRSLDSSYLPPRELPPKEAVRSAARRLIWPERDPFAAGARSTVSVVELGEATDTGELTGLRRARAYRIDVHPLLSSRITWLEPLEPLRGVAIYHNGHCGAASCSGMHHEVPLLEALLRRGWQVIHMDMPLQGLNAVDRKNATFYGANRHDFDFLDHGGASPLELFMLPVKAVVDLIEDRAGGATPPIVMLGRSGGGWTSLLYGTLDPRVRAVVSIAGGVPMSMRLRTYEDKSGYPDMGDYEQMVPYFYQGVTYDDILATTGDEGALFIHNEHDGCCFRLAPDDPLVRAHGTREPGHRRFFIDTTNTAHSLGPDALPVIGDFLDELFPGP